jgi:hypothetical protein
MNHCPICKSPSSAPKTIGGGSWEIDCSRCGSFKIGDELIGFIEAQPKTLAQIANMSGYIRENAGSVITIAQLDFLLNLRIPSLSEKATRLFRSIATAHPNAGEQIRISKSSMYEILGVIYYGKKPEKQELFEKNCNELLPWLARAWIKDAVEFDYVLNRVLMADKGFLEPVVPEFDPFRITPEGWAFLLTLGQSDSNSSTVFIAMWFDPTMDQVWTEGLYKGVADAGYNPVRIDKHQHNNRIDDEIIVKIKESKFLVADFTDDGRGGRGGVYFEAGYAVGLGKPVIWVVEAAQLDKIHFDTRQYSFIRWDRGNLPDLRNDLRLRIEATIGKGPLKT